MMQELAIGVILAVAVGYAGWRVFKSTNADKSFCEDCELKKNCKKFGQSK